MDWTQRLGVCVCVCAVARSTLHFEHSRVLVPCMRVDQLPLNVDGQAEQKKKMQTEFGICINGW